MTEDTQGQVITRTDGTKVRVINVQPQVTFTSNGDMVVKEVPVLPPDAIKNMPIIAASAPYTKDWDENDELDQRHPEFQNQSLLQVMTSKLSIKAAKGDRDAILQIQDRIHGKALQQNKNENVNVNMTLDDFLTNVRENHEKEEANPSPINVTPNHTHNSMEDLLQ